MILAAALIKIHWYAAHQSCFSGCRFLLPAVCVSLPRWCAGPLLSRNVPFCLHMHCLCDVEAALELHGREWGPRVYEVVSVLGQGGILGWMTQFGGGADLGQDRQAGKGSPTTY